MAVIDYGRAGVDKKVRVSPTAWRGLKMTIGGAETVERSLARPGTGRLALVGI